MAERNSYIVTKALNSYLKGSVIIAISGHLVTTTDAVIVSWLIGSKAFTAVNIVIPVLTIFSSLMIMLSTGASISISKSLGNREKDKVNLSFSSSVIGAVIIGVAAALITFKFTPDIIRYLVNKDHILYHYAVQYLKNFCYAIPVLIIAGVMEYIVRTDGNTRLVSISVWIGIIVNILLDIVFIKFLNYGLAGAAWATAINYFLTLCICTFHFFSRYNTLRWCWNIKNYITEVFKNCKLGFSTSLNNILLGVSLFVINNIMLRFVGNEGIYCWAVCYQIFLILQMLLSGIDTSIFAIGGVLLGEDDVSGLDFLYRRSAIYLIIGVFLLIGLIIFFPEFFGKLFGNKGDDRLDLLPSVLKIFSLFLFPYAMVMQVRAVFTILSRSFLSLSLCIVIFAVMILFVFLSALYDRDWLWWSFPVSSWSVLLFVVAYTTILHFKNKNLRFFSLIPIKVNDPSYSSSIALDYDAVNLTKVELDEFLKKENVNKDKIDFSTTVTGEIMDNILQKLLRESKKKRYFDINVRIKGNKIIVILKDDGIRLDRNKEESIMTDLNKEISSFKFAGDNSIQNHPEFTVNYFYMNEQNTFTLTFS